MQLRQFRFLPPSLTSDVGFDLLDFDGVFDFLDFDGVFGFGSDSDSDSDSDSSFVFDSDSGFGDRGPPCAPLLLTKAIEDTFSAAAAAAAAFFNTDGLTKRLLLANCGCL